MKSIDFFEMSGFKKIRKSMNIPQNYRADFSLPRQLHKIKWKDPLIQGLDIRINDKSFQWSAKGLFYKGNRVMLYIREQLASYKNQGNGYKYHIAWCRTLKNMKQRHHDDKYAVSTGVNDIFMIDFVDGNDHAVIEQREEKLHVCKNCLMTINWHGYRYATPEARVRIYEQFSLKEFFDEFKECKDQKGLF